MAIGSFLGVKWPGRGVDHPTPSSAEAKDRVELYLYSRSEHSWPVLGWTLLLPLPFSVQYSNIFMNYMIENIFKIYMKIQCPNFFPRKYTTFQMGLRTWQRVLHAMSSFVPQDFPLSCFIIVGLPSLFLCTQKFYSFRCMVRIVRSTRHTHNIYIYIYIYMCIFRNFFVLLISVPTMLWVLFALKLISGIMRSWFYWSVICTPDYGTVHFLRGPIQTLRLVRHCLYSRGKSNIMSWGQATGGCNICIVWPYQSVTHPIYIVTEVAYGVPN